MLSHNYDGHNVLFLTYPHVKYFCWTLYHGYEFDDQQVNLAGFFHQY